MVQSCTQRRSALVNLPVAIQFPFDDLRGVQLKMLGQLRQGSVFAQSGHGYLGLERQRVGAAGAPR